MMGGRYLSAYVQVPLSRWHRCQLARCHQPVFAGPLLRRRRRPRRKMENAPRIFVARGVITSERFRLQRSILQLLQRAHLEAYRSWLRRKPFVFTRERVLAEALLLCRHILCDHLQQARQRELLRAFLVNRCQHRFFERRQ
jgi:hypothetical protein